MRFDLPFAALSELLQEHMIEPENVSISLPQHDFYRLEAAFKASAESMMRYQVVSGIERFREMTIHGIKITIKPSSSRL